MDRAYTLLEIKAVDESARVIEGFATTPTADRAGDIVDPLGAAFTLPLPLLWQHDTKQPIGEVLAADVSQAGILIRARIATVDDPGPLRDRIDEAWQSIKARLVRGLSIGFQPIEVEARKGTRSGLHIRKWLWAELSAVTIPSNLEATISMIKALAPPVPDPGRKDTPRMPNTIADQISTFETTRAAHLARQNAMMADANDSTLEGAEAGEYDGLTERVKAIDLHLLRLRELEAANIKAAAPVPPTPDPAAPAAPRAPLPTVHVKGVEPGIGFARLARALLVTGGNRAEAAEYAKQWRDSTPQVELALKAAVAAGTTTDATWAGPLAQMKPLADEFLALLRPQTILGKIPGFRNVPFNISIPSQTGGGSYNWVGQGAPKPLTKLAFGTQTLGMTKCAGIVVITEELARSSTPSAESLIRNDMITGIAQFLDVEFTDPTKAAVANVSPGSVTNGVTPITSAGTSSVAARTDLQALVGAMTAAGLSASGATFIMSETNATALGFALNPLGQPQFPGLSVAGGSIYGLPVVVSQVAGANVILVHAPSILYADDGGVTIDVSREASVQMADNPDNPATATTVFTSFWQSNLVGLRAERFINWKKVRTGCVQYTVQNYGA